MHVCNYNLLSVFRVKLVNFAKFDAVNISCRQDAVPYYSVTICAVAVSLYVTFTLNKRRNSNIAQSQHDDSSLESLGYLSFQARYLGHRDPDASGLSDIWRIKMSTLALHSSVTWTYRFLNTASGSAGKTYDPWHLMKCLITAAAPWNLVLCSAGNERDLAAYFGKLDWVALFRRLVGDVQENFTGQRSKNSPRRLAVAWSRLATLLNSVHWRPKFFFLVLDEFFFLS